MAVEARLPIFNFSSTLAAGCSALDTTITCSAFATTLPVVSGGSQYVPLVLANDSLGVEEVVYVTAHTSSSVSATVLRAQEGTTARVFNSGDVVRCAPTVRDMQYASNASAPPTNPFYGLKWLQLDTGIVMTYTAYGWVDEATVKNDPGRKHIWTQTNAVLTAGADAKVVGLNSGNGGGTIASQSAGNLTLNKAGLWTLAWNTVTDNTVAGFVNAYLIWPSGAFLVNPWTTGPRVPTGTAGSGIVRTYVTWTGYATAAQAAQPIQVFVGQNNTNSGNLNNCQYYLSAEYLGG